MTGTPPPKGSNATAARPQLDVPAVDLPRFQLSVVSGRDASLTLDIDETTQVPRIFVGTSPSCHLVLNDPLVSRRHLALGLEPGFLRLQDLDSTNGTQVDRLDVVEARLTGGETIVVGDTRIEVRRLGDGTRGRRRARPGRRLPRHVRRRRSRA